MTNAELKRIRRWNWFKQLNAEDYYCTTALCEWAESGTDDQHPDPRQYPLWYKRVECGRCGKCDDLKENKDWMYWKKKAFDLAKSYGLALRRIESLQRDLKLLLDVISAGVNHEAYPDVSEGFVTVHRDHSAVYTCSDPKNKE